MLERLCPECHVKLMEIHEEYHGYIRCRLCGFSKKEIEDPRKITGIVIGNTKPNKP